MLLVGRNSAERHNAAADWRAGWSSGFRLTEQGLNRVEAKRKLAVVRVRGTQKASGAGQLASRLWNSGLSLKEMRERFASAFGNAPIGMALVDLDGCWFQVNDALCRITGYSECELRATTLRSLIHPDDLELDRLFLQQLLEGRIPSYQIEKRCHHIWGPRSQRQSGR